MTLEILQSFLGWCTAINVGLLTIWFLFFWLGHDLIYRFHAKIFPMPKETFNAIHYAGLAGYKTSILLLNLVPYLAIALVL